MKNLFVDERPSALPATCAPVPGAMASPVAAAFAHALTVGGSAVRDGHTASYGVGTGASQIQSARWARFQGRNASAYGTQLAVQDGAKTITVGVVRGVPPRGWPV